MKTILVADGDNSVRNIVRLLFTEKMGYRVVAVSKGADAILKAKEIMPDIVLADAHLSDKDGYQVAGEIKSDPFLRSTRVLLLNSAFAALNKKKALKAHVDGVIIKPFGTEIVEKVGSLLHHGEKTGIIKFIPIHPREISKRYAARLATLHGKLAERTKSTYIKSFGVIVQTITLNLKGSYRLASAFPENVKATILRNIKAVTKSLRFPSVQIPIRKYVAELKMVYNTLVFQTKYDYSKSFNSIAQTVTKSLKDYCQPAREFAANFKTTMGKLKHQKTPTRMLKTKSFSFPSLDVLRREHFAKFEILFKQPVEQKKYAFSNSFKITTQLVAKRLKDYSQAARGFTANFKTTMGKLKRIKTATQILMTKSSSFLSIKTSRREYLAKFEMLYKKLIVEKKYNYSKSFKIVIQAVTKHLEDYCQAARGLAAKFRLAIGKLRETKISPHILTVRSLEPSLVPLFFTRGSLISLIGMGILLLITTFIPSSNKKLEGTSSFFNTSVSTTGLTEPESKPNFDVKFYDDARDKNLKETVRDIEGQYTNEKLSEAIIKENHKPSRKKQTSRKIRRKSDYKDLPEKDLKEVLKGAFLLQ